MPNKIDAVLDEFVNGVTIILGDRVKKVILYGSYARGDYREDSDIDIMILADLTDDEVVKYRAEIADFTFDIEMENDVILSPLLKNIDRFYYWIDALPFYMNIQKEGVVLRG
jgi:predicted nucleotidyltransferase